jgi:hypothetical protein
MNKRRMIVLTCIFTMLASSFAVLAQDQTKQRQENAEVKARVGAELKAKMVAQGEMVRDNIVTRGGDTFTFIAAEGGFGGKVVKGAPYSAEGVSENIQVLQDGNRIVRKNTSMIYRDSEGRTRQEQTLRAIGSYATSGEPPRTFSIFDPVANVHYALDPNSKTAHKMELPRFEKVGDGGTMVFVGGDEAVKMRRPGPPPEGIRKEGSVTFDRVVATGGKEGLLTVDRVGPVGGVDAITMTRSDNVKTEALGKQVIEGVEAEGTRTTHTIPAGEIGNELPINIVTENWYSPELQVTVMKKHTDPRQGEMTYRLTNIRRTEPDHSLFEVPADYTVKETLPSKMKLDLEREFVREKLKKNNDQ